MIRAEIGLNNRQIINETYSFRREIDLKIIFWMQISYSPHSGTNTKIKWDMCLCILISGISCVTMLKYA
jgi:hypothetical protein